MLDNLLNKIKSQPLPIIIIGAIISFILIVLSAYGLGYIVGWVIAFIRNHI